MAEAFSAHHIEADTLFFGEKGLVFNETTVFATPFPTLKSTSGHLLLYYFLADALLLRRIKVEAYDFILIRHLPTHPLFLIFLKKLKQRNPALRILIEFPTWPYDLEMKGLKNKLLLALDRLTRRHMHRYVDVALHNGADTSIWGIPVIRMANGIHPADFPVPDAPVDLPDRPFSLIFAGNISRWHGLDRLIEGVKRYEKPEDVILTIVGAGSEKAALVELVQRLQLQDSVQFLPPVNKAALRRLYQQSHMAVGSLALHRLGLQTGTPLKHREYVACGLPFIYAGHDPDFEMVSNIFIVPADESPVDLGNVVGFFSALRNKAENYHNVLYEHAMQYLSWEHQIKPIIHYLL